MSKKSTKLTVKLPSGRAGKHGGYSYLTTGKLPEHRREVSRYLTAARENLIRDFGPKEEDLSAGQLILIDRIVTKLGVIRCMEEHIRERSVMSRNNLAPCLRGPYIAYNNSVRLDLMALGIDKRAGAKVLDLADYIRQKDEERDAKGPDPGPNSKTIARPSASWRDGDGEDGPLKTGKDDQADEDQRDVDAQEGPGK